MAAMLPFIAVGAYFGTQPRYAIISLGFLVFFLILVAPGNPMRYDLAESLNTYVAFLNGQPGAVIAFRVVLPPNRRAEALVQARAVRNDGPPPDPQPPRPARDRLGAPAAPKAGTAVGTPGGGPGRNASHALDSGAAAVIVGRHILRLRQAATDAALPAPARAAAARTRRQLPPPVRRAGGNGGDRPHRSRCPRLAGGAAPALAHRGHAA